MTGMLSYAIFKWIENCFVFERFSVGYRWSKKKPIPSIQENNLGLSYSASIANVRIKIDFDVHSVGWKVEKNNLLRVFSDRPRFFFFCFFHLPSDLPNRTCLVIVRVRDLFHASCKKYACTHALKITEVCA